MLTIQENQLPGPLKSSDIKIPTTVATKLKLLMEYKQEEKNKAESQGNSDVRSILNELQEFKMNLNELKTLNELQEIKTDLTELKTQLFKLQENKNRAETQENSEMRSIVNSVLRSINELKDFQSNQKAQGNSVMRSMLNDFKNELKMDLTEQKTQEAKQQLTLSNTNKDTTPPKK